MVTVYNNPPIVYGETRNEELLIYIPDTGTC